MSCFFLISLSRLFVGLKPKKITSRFLQYKFRSLLRNTNLQNSDCFKSREKVVSSSLDEEESSGQEKAVGSKSRKRSGAGGVGGEENLDAKRKRRVQKGVGG